MTIEPYRDCHAGGLLDLWARALPYDALDRPTFERRVLLDPNLEPDGLLLAFDPPDPTPRGFVLCLTHRVPIEKAGTLPGNGYLTAFGVAPEHRGQGVGRALLARAETFCRERGCHRISLAPYTPNYFVPGVDRERYAAGLAWLLRHRFVETSEALAMDAAIGTFELSAELRDKERELAANGVVVRPFTRERLVDYLGFMVAHMPGPWLEQARHNLREMTHGRFPAEAIQLALADDRIVGYCQFEGEHFGPFGVLDEWQGRGVGSVLLARTLYQMRVSGLHAAFVLWTGQRAAEGVYRRLGFTVSRRFAVLSRDLG